MCSIFKSADEKKIYRNQIYDLDNLKIEELLFPRPLLETVYILPDFEHIHKELLKDGVTLKLLWEEYVLECKKMHKPSYHQTQFNKLYRNLVKKNNLTMHIKRKLGNRLIIIIIRASGSGKTWLSCAFGTNTCQDKFKVRYYRMPELFDDFEVKRIQENYRQFIKQLSKYDLLIIHEFLLTAKTEIERYNLLELMEKRTKKSTILCSQWSPEGWHDKLGNGPIADAILYRIINSSYKIFLDGKSLREKYSNLKK